MCTAFLPIYSSSFYVISFLASFLVVCFAIKNFRVLFDVPLLSKMRVFLLLSIFVDAFFLLPGSFDILLRIYFALAVEMSTNQRLWRIHLQTKAQYIDFKLKASKYIPACINFF